MCIFPNYSITKVPGYSNIPITYEAAMSFVNLKKTLETIDENHYFGSENKKKFEI